MNIKYKLLIVIVVSIIFHLIFSSQMNKEKSLKGISLINEYSVDINDNESEKRQDQIDLNTEALKTSRNADYIVECSEEAYQIFKEEDLKAKDFLDIFKNSKHNKSKLAYALSLNDSILKQDDEQDKNNRTIELLDLLDEAEDKSLIFYYLVAGCNANENQMLCEKTIIPQAIANDSNNGALWLAIASFEARRNNLNGFELAIRQIIASPNYNQYWSDSIEIFNDALLKSGVVHHGARAIMSIGFSAALSVYSNQSIFRACTQSAEIRPDIAQMCIDVGAKMVSESKTLLSKGLGYALQQKVLRALGEETQANKIDKIKNKKALYTGLEIKASSLMEFDQELNDYWFTKLKLFGEIKAFELATIEAIRLSSNPGYDPCPKNE